MQLIEIFPILKKHRAILRQNYTILRQTLDEVGKNYEQKPYQELLLMAEQSFTVKGVNGRELSLSAEAYYLKKDETICFCIDADGLPTLFGIKLSYHFYKHPDETVSY